MLLVGIFGTLPRPSNLFPSKPPPSKLSVPTPPFLPFSFSVLLDTNPFSVRFLSSTSFFLSDNDFFSRDLSILKLLLS